jgi:short-subunit dehydrogenase
MPIAAPKRGHDLVLVARDRDRREVPVERLRRETGVTVDILRADLTDSGDLTDVEARLQQHKIADTAD